MTDTTALSENVKEYYGKILTKTADLKTGACCSSESIPAEHRKVLKDVHPEILDRFYGCGSPLPPLLYGTTVLDLGCGTGRDVYLASKLAGPEGRVIGIDMTDEQLDVARKHVDYQMEKFGYPKANVEFHKGYIEDLASACIEDNSIDVVISNCVINLSPDKPRVFSEIFRVLKEGGELYFADVFADRRIPEEVAADPVIHGECLGGAMYTQDFRRLMGSLNVPDYRTVSMRPVPINDPSVAQKIGRTSFYSITVRAFKLPILEDRCENYGQVAFYKGTIPGNPHSFTLDDHHTFEKNLPVLVCGNTAAMLEETRYGDHFKITGDRSTHFGLFNCGPAPDAPAMPPCC